MIKRIWGGYRSKMDDCTCSNLNGYEMYCMGNFPCSSMSVSRIGSHHSNLRVRFYSQVFGNRAYEHNSKIFLDAVQ